MSLTRIGSIGINTGIAFAGVTTIVTLNTANDALSIGATVNVGSGITLGASGDIFATGVSTVTTLKVGSGVTVSSDGDVFFTGIATGNGSGLTALNATQLTSGTVPTARLGSGTASSSTFLRGDSTFATVTSTTINNNADNRVITGSGTANTLEGEANLTFDGSKLTVSSTLPEIFLTDTNASNARGRLNANGGGLLLGADNDNAAADSVISFAVDGTERLRIDSNGRVMIGDTDTDNALTDSDNLVIGSASGDNGMTIVSQSGNYNGSIRFSDGANSGADSYRGTIQYYHGENYMRFYTDGSERLRIVSNGEVGINVTDPEAYGLNGTGYGGLVVQSPSGNYSGITIRSNYAAGGALFFADGSGSNAERKNLGFTADHVNKRMDIRVDGNGVCRFTQYGFHPNPSDSAAANALDDYEEGQWTPTASNFTISTQYSANYTKIGDVVFIQAYLQAATGSGTSAVAVGGLPYTVRGSQYYSYAACRIGGTNAQHNMVFQFNSGGTTAFPYVYEGNINEGMISGQHLIFSGFYHV